MHGKNGKSKNKLLQSAVTPDHSKRKVFNQYEELKT